MNQSGLQWQKDLPSHKRALTQLNNFFFSNSEDKYPEARLHCARALLQLITFSFLHPHRNETVGKAWTPRGEMKSHVISLAQSGMVQQMLNPHVSFTLCYEPYYGLF